MERKRMLSVDLGELTDEKESLSNYLRLKLKVDVTAKGNNVFVHSQNLPSEELKRLVNKFVYHQNLMNKYGVVLENHDIRIIRFEVPGQKKKESKKTSSSKGYDKKPTGKKKGTPPSTLKHGVGR